MPYELGVCPEGFVTDIIESPKFQHLLLREGEFWNLFLSPHQYTPGRAYLWLRRHKDLHAEHELLIDEITEAQAMQRRWFEAVQKLWGAVHYNCEWLGNEFEHHRGHGHKHLTPRYYDQVSVDGVVFSDPTFGTAPYERALPGLTQHQRAYLCAKLREALE